MRTQNTTSTAGWCVLSLSVCVSSSSSIVVFSSVNARALIALLRLFAIIVIFLVIVRAHTSQGKRAASTNERKKFARKFIGHFYYSTIK